MHTLLHYHITHKALSEFDALISFLADLPPAKGPLHRQLWRHVNDDWQEKISELLLQLNIPRKYWPGVYAHIFQDYLWFKNIRRHYFNRNSIDFHRCIEIRWTLHYFRAKKIDAASMLSSIKESESEAIIFLNLFDETDLSRVNSIIHKIFEPFLQGKYRARCVADSEKGKLQKILRLIDKAFNEEEFIEASRSFATP